VPPGPPGTLTKLRAVHPHSIPAGMTVSDDGRYLYVAEGGTLAVLDAPSDMHVEIKFAPVSSLGLRAVELELDPDADLEAPSNAYLYVAAGREGLWVMGADPGASVTLPASRIDDALDTGGQTSDRWCNDVDFIQWGTTDYLLALFAEKDASRLRLYKLQHARNVLGPQETGNEIAAEVNVAVDLADVDEDPEPDEVHLYVPVARVGLEVLKFTPGPGQNLTKIGHIDLPNGEAGVRIRDDGVERTLLVGDAKSGVRIYEYQ